MSIPEQPEAEVQRVLQKHVREVAVGAIEIMGIAREPGKRVMVAVRSLDGDIHPVSVISGHLKAISRDLGGEKVSVLLWSESPETFICNALAPYGPAAVSIRMPKVTLNGDTHQAIVEVGSVTLAYFSSEDGMRLRLASRLVGWEIQLVCRDQN